jgi:hypothetical protein
MMLTFIAGTYAIKVLSVSLAGRFAGFRGLDLINLAITTNARGGPGIVLASVALDAGIISSQFYTTLGVAAVYRGDRAKMRIRADGQNLTDVLDVIDFGGLFSGNANGPPRSFSPTPNWQFLVAPRCFSV